MERELKEFLNKYKTQLEEEVEESFRCDIESGIYYEICELADDLENEGVDLDKID